MRKLISILMIALFVLFIAGCGKEKTDDADREGNEINKEEIEKCIDICLDKEGATEDACVGMCRPKARDKPPLEDGEKPFREGMDDKPPLEKDDPPKEPGAESDDAPASVEDLDDDNMDVDLGDVI